MDNTILFDINHRMISIDGRSAFSDVVYIPVGKTALLSLYNMTNDISLDKDPDTGKYVLKNDSCVIVHKLSFSQTGDIARKLECGEVVNIQDALNALLQKRRLMYEPVYQCGQAWKINPCNNFVLIPTPGFYMLEVMDINQFDTAYIEYHLLSVQDSLSIPDDFKLGSRV